MKVNSESENQIRAKFIETGKILRPASYTGEILSANRFVVELELELQNLGYYLESSTRDFIATMKDDEAIEFCESILRSVKYAKGAHVQHQPYFKHFAKSNYDREVRTWLENLNKWVVAFLQGEEIQPTSYVYGAYRHTYEEYMKVCSGVNPKRKDLEPLQLSDIQIATDCERYMEKLLLSTTPLSTDNLEFLAKHFYILEDVLDEEVLHSITMKENLALYNAWAVQQDKLVYFKSATDLLRCAAALEEPKHASLQESCRFNSKPRKLRRRLLYGFEQLCRHSDLQHLLDDAQKHSERFKRLSERLHPFENRNRGKFKRAKAFFAQMHSKDMLTTQAQVEAAYAAGDLIVAANILSRTPGKFFRQFDKLLRMCRSNGQYLYLLQVARPLMQKTSTSVLLSLLSHLKSRQNGEIETRAIKLKSGVRKVIPVAPKFSSAFDLSLLHELIVDRLKAGLPAEKSIYFDPKCLDVAVTLSGKNQPEGLGTAPVGTKVQLEATTNILRLFFYWKETHQRTDYDLSVLFLDSEFKTLSWCSWTDLRSSDSGALHSGDLTESHNGATEFVDIRLSELKSEIKYAIPAVNHFCGERLDELLDNRLGWMQLEKLGRGEVFQADKVETAVQLKGDYSIFAPYILDVETLTITWINAAQAKQDGCSMIELSDRELIEITKAMFSAESIRMSDIRDWYVQAGVEILDQPKADCTVVALSHREEFNCAKRVVLQNQFKDWFLA